MVTEQITILTLEYEEAAIYVWWRQGQVPLSWNPLAFSRTSALHISGNWGSVTSVKQNVIPQLLNSYYLNSMTLPSPP